MPGPLNDASGSANAAVPLKLLPLVVLALQLVVVVQLALKVCGEVCETMPLPLSTCPTVASETNRELNLHTGQVKRDLLLCYPVAEQLTNFKPVKANFRPFFPASKINCLAKQTASGNISIAYRLRGLVD